MLSDILATVDKRVNEQEATKNIVKVHLGHLPCLKQINLNLN